MILSLLQRQTLLRNDIAAVSHTARVLLLRGGMLLLGLLGLFGLLCLLLALLLVLLEAGHEATKVRPARRVSTLGEAMMEFHVLHEGALGVEQVERVRHQQGLSDAAQGADERGQVAEAALV